MLIATSSRTGPCVLHTMSTTAIIVYGKTNVIFFLKNDIKNADYQTQCVLHITQDA